MIFISIKRSLLFLLYDQKALNLTKRYLRFMLIKQNIDKKNIAIIRN